MLSSWRRAARDIFNVSWIFRNSPRLPGLFVAAGFSTAFPFAGHNDLSLQFPHLALIAGEEEIEESADDGDGA